MESLSSNVTSFDELDINCLTHKIPAVGVCGNTQCKERKLVCMKCISSAETCFSTNQHELVCLSELLYRFFTKQNSNKLDISELNSMMEALKQSDKNNTSKALAEYIANSQKTMTSCFTNFTKEADQKISESFINYSSSFEGLKSILNSSNQDEIDKLTHCKIPDCLFDFNLIKVKDFMKSKKVDQEEKDNCIRTIKAFSDKESLTKTIQSADKLKGINNFVSQKEIEKLQEKVDNKLNEIEININKQLDDLEKLFIISKEEAMTIKPVSGHFKNDPNNLTFKYDICLSAHKSNSIDGVFCTFRSMKGDSLVVWGTPTFGLEVYDLKTESICKTIPNAHTNTIFSCSHFLDKKTNKDLVGTSSYDKSLKVWAVDTWTSIVHVQAAHTGYYIYSICILSDITTKNNFIISSAPNEYMKVWDFTGKFVKEFGVNSESTYFIDAWLDSKNKKHYILNASSADVKSYDFSTGLLYKKYPGTPQTWHMSALVVEFNKMPQLIESDGSGNIRIWDFHLATLLKTITTSGINLRGVCLWNETYLLSSGSDYHVKLYDIKKGVFVKSLTGHTSTVCAVEKIVHPKYGECLISHGLDGKLKLWIDNKQFK